MNAPRPHESVKKTVLRCMQKVSIVRQILRRLTREPATANDLSPNVLLQRCITRTDLSADLSDRPPDLATSWQSSLRYAGAWPDSDRNAKLPEYRRDVFTSRSAGNKMGGRILERL